MFFNMHTLVKNAATMKLNLKDFITKEFQTNQDFLTVASFGLANILIDPFGKEQYTLAHLAVGRQLFLAEKHADLRPYGLLWDLSMLYCGYSTAKEMAPVYEKAFESVIEHFGLKPLSAAEMVPIKAFSFSNYFSGYTEKAVEEIGYKAVSLTAINRMVKSILT